MALSSSKTLIESAVWDVENASRRVKTLRINQRQLTSTIAMMERLIARFKGYESTHCWPEVDAWSRTVILRVSMNAKVTSLKAGIVVDLLKFMLETDFVAVDTTDSVGSSYASRTYNFKRPANNTTTDTLEVRFAFHADVSENGEDASCKRVQVGVETKEVPKYEIKCD